MARKTLNDQERAYLQALGQRISDSREKRGWTQDELCGRARKFGVGMSRRTLGAIEKGIHNVSVVTAAALIRAVSEGGHGSDDFWNEIGEEAADACKVIVGALGDPARRLTALTAIKMLSPNSPSVARGEPPERKRLVNQ